LREINSKQNDFKVGHNIYSTLTKEESMNLNGARVPKNMNFYDKVIN
jgi:hypothetical protein